MAPIHVLTEEPTDLSDLMYSILQDRVLLRIKVILPDVSRVDFNWSFVFSFYMLRCLWHEKLRILEKCLAAAIGPCSVAYLPMSALSLLLQVFP